MTTTAVDVTVTFTTERPLSQAAGQKFWRDATRFAKAAGAYQWEHTVRDVSLGNAILGAEQYVHQLAFEDGTTAELVSVAGEVSERTVYPKAGAR